MKELSINLMRLRKLNGLTQHDIAQAAGISRVAYRNLEKAGIKICLCDFNLSNIFGFSIGETDEGPAGYCDQHWKVNFS